VSEWSSYTTSTDLYDGDRQIPRVLLETWGQLLAVSKSIREEPRGRQWRLWEGKSRQLIGDIRIGSSSTKLWACRVDYKSGKKSKHLAHEPSSIHLACGQKS